MVEYHLHTEKLICLNYETAMSNPILDTDTLGDEPLGLNISVAAFIP